MELCLDALIYIYRVIATASCNLQTVEQFPWEVVANLKSVIKKLEKMSETIEIVTSDFNENDRIEVDQNEWPHLAMHLEELRLGQFKGLALNSKTASEGRRTRTQSDIGNENDLITIKNRLTTLCSYQAIHIARRTINNEEHPFPAIISSMEGCFDIQKMISASMDEDFDLKTYGVDSLEKVLKEASYKMEESEQIKSEYFQMKEKIFDFLFKENSSNAHFLRQFEHIIYKTHICSKNCNVHKYKKCPNYMKIIEPRSIITMKVLHLLLKFREFYEGIPGVLHLFLRCAAKTHAEAVAESMGNYVDFYSDKKRGLDITDIGSESYIHWNGPPVHHAGPLGKAALDKKFGGRSNWRFVTKQCKLESLVVKRLKRIAPRVPFFQ